jgi:hypothetical protein
MDENKNQGMNVNINFDTTPVLYTDNISMTTNQDGFVLDIMQRLMNSNQARIVARIGMSREHAKKLVKEMGRLLAVTEGQGQTQSGKNKN